MSNDINEKRLLRWKLITSGSEECMETCRVGEPCPHGKSCDHIGAGRATATEMEAEYEHYLRWYWILRTHIGEAKWIDLYDEHGDDDDE